MGYNGESLLTLWNQRAFVMNKDGTYTIDSTCLGCQNRFYMVLDTETYNKVSDAIREADEEWMEHAFDKLEELETASAAQETVNSSNAPQAAQEKSNDGSKIEKFQNQIRSINNDLTDLELASKIREALSLLVDERSSDIEACMKIIKDEFKLNMRAIEAFKRDFRQIQEEAKLHKEMAYFQHLNQVPKEPNEEEKKAALAFLQHPDLIKNISRDLAVAGDIVGEETNKMILYLAAISRKLKKPISLVIFGKSSSGKSYLANAIAKFIPPEAQLLLSSASPRAFEQYAESLKHKFILVQEWEGAKQMLPTIRTLQSEGKLYRLVAKRGGNDIEPITKPIECPCTVVITTTKEGIHNENSTRIFELYADEGLTQTEAVVTKILRDSDLALRKKKMK
jgi:DNA replication protein DnaC